MKIRPDTVILISRYEAGEMDDDQTEFFFQYLIDSGLAWQLQGHYARTAANLIQQGKCHAQIKRHATGRN